MKDVEGFSLGEGFVEESFLLVEADEPIGTEEQRRIKEMLSVVSAGGCTVTLWDMETQKKVSQVIPDGGLTLVTEQLSDLWSEKIAVTYIKNRVRQGFSFRRGDHSIGVTMYGSKSGIKALDVVGYKVMGGDVPDREMCLRVIGGKSEPIG